jgi:hypothetical protein
MVNLGYGFKRVFGTGVEFLQCGLQMSNSSKANVCFVMFVDQMSLDAIRKDGQVPNGKGILSACGK